MVSKISPSEEREEKIKESFENQEVYFNYPKNLDGFNYLIEAFMQRKGDYVNSELGEDMNLDKLMDDVWTTSPALLTNLTFFLIF